MRVKFCTRRIDGVEVAERRLLCDAGLAVRPRALSDGRGRERSPFARPCETSPSLRNAVADGEQGACNHVRAIWGSL